MTVQLEKGPSEDSQSRRRTLENHEKSLEIHGFSEFGSRRASRGLLRYYEPSDSLRSFQALLDSTHLVDGRALLLGVGVVLVSVDHGAVLLPVVQAGVESRYKHVDDIDEVHLVGWASTKQVRVTVSPW